MDGFPKWSAATLGERVQMVVIQAFAWGVVFPVGVIGILAIIGVMIDGLAEYSTAITYCQTHAVTPYEYHQCK